MKVFGLIGKNLSHSFSKSYFDKEFFKEGNHYSYKNIEIQSIKEVFESDIINRLSGFNVTIPYKEEVIAYLDEVQSDAQKIGAVNCVKKERKKWIGYNTDYQGFYESINPHLKPHHQKALVLGSGGASKAISYTLNEILGINYTIISREGKNNYLSINETILSEFSIIINCTPLGTYPKENEFPPIPYHLLSKDHLLFDLVYNPLETAFLKKGKKQGCQTLNGLEMLHLQAKKSWEIWKN